MATSRRMQPANAAARAASVRKAPPPPARPASRKQTEEIGRGFVSTSAKDRTSTYHEEDREVEVLRQTFNDNEHPAFVKVGAGMTVNLGNYESLRIDCAVTLPCHPENIQETYELASNFVADRISEEQSAWVGEGNQRGKR